MYGSSTDLIIRRFMVRVAKPILALSVVIMVGVGCLPMFPAMADDIGSKIGQFYPKVSGMPIVIVLLLLTMEMGKIVTKGMWSPRTCWVAFFMVCCSVPVTVCGYFYAQYCVAESEVNFALGLRWITIALIGAFLIKFASEVTRQRLFEKIYVIVFLCVAICALYSSWIGA